MAVQQKCLAIVAVFCCLSVTIEGAFEFKHHNNQELSTILDDVHSRCPNITRVYTLSENSVVGNALVLIEVLSDMSTQLNTLTV